MFKVIIAGSRGFQNYPLLRAHMDHLLQNISDEIEIVCGQSPGADLLGARYAQERGYPIRYFPADWEQQGRKAGPMRNVQMGDYADALVAFWDGKSKGTAHMIQYACQKGLKVRIKRV